jgi:hypothetical protein
MANKLTGFNKNSNRDTKNLTGQQKNLLEGIKMVQDGKKGYRRIIHFLVGLSNFNLSVLL